MSPLYDPARHERLAGPAWDPQQAREAIDRIVADTRAAVQPDGAWPIHPSDGPPDCGPALDLYLGAAGVIWALDVLNREGTVRPGETFAAQMLAHLVRARQEIAALGRPIRSYLFAEAGMMLSAYKVAPSPDLADTLSAAVAENTGSPALELCWGPAGTMLCALAMHRWTGEPRWAALFRAGATALEAKFEFDPTLGAALWTQDLYGHQERALGLAHGFAGNAAALIAGRDLLDPATWARWSSALAQTLAATAQRAAGRANWVSYLQNPPAARLSRLQICHGAPGIVVGLAGLPEPIDALLLEAGALVWEAGPLLKGPGLCHGTAGNGYAFLKLYVRTGDPLWLDRARAFAMHAIAQSEAGLSALGQRRYSLWTGDLGLALYLWDCVEGKARFPTVDVG